MFESGYPTLPAKCQERVGISTSYAPFDSTDTVRPPAPLMTAPNAGMANNVRNITDFWTTLDCGNLRNPLGSGVLILTQDRYLVDTHSVPVPLVLCYALRNVRTCRNSEPR